MTLKRLWEGSPKPELYPQKTNLFAVSISGKSKVYRVDQFYLGVDDPDVVKKGQNSYLTLKRPNVPSALIEPDLFTIRAFLFRHFGQKLGANGFASKGWYHWYYKEAAHPESHAGVFKIYDHAFEFRFLVQNNSIYVVIDPSVAITTEISIKELYEQGVPVDELQGFYVSRTDSARGIHGYLISTSATGGRSHPVTCEVRNGRTFEIEKVDGTTIKPESRPEVLQKFLQLLGINKRLVELHQRLAFLHSTTPSRDRLDKTLKIAQYLATKIFPIQFGGFKAELSTEPEPVRGEGFLRGSSVEEPQLLFDKTDTAALNATPYQGLRFHGPYEKEKPTINAVLVAPASNMQQLDRLVNELNNGVVGLPGGMGQFFRTQIKVIRQISLTTPSIEEYEQVCSELVKSLNQSNLPDVAVIYVPKTGEDFFNTPYYRAKAILGSVGIPTQMITDATFANLRWSYLNLGAALYAKAGAIPWVLEENLIDFDIIIGISVSNDVSFSSRMGTRRTNMGSANIFDRYGRWMFFEGTATRPFEKGQRVAQIRQLLEEALTKYKAEKKEFPKRVALHYYKKFKTEEIETILSVLRGKVGDFQLALTNIDDTHPIRLYDTSREDGTYKRGGYVVLSDNEFLVCSTGSTDLYKRRIGTPKIVKVRVQQFPTEFTNMESVARQVLGLTKLNYATLTPLVREPASLLFANAIARLALAMSEQEWNSMVREPLSESIKRRMWFL